MNDDSPYPISICCIAHRLALCTSQAANRIPGFSKFKETSTASYRSLDWALGSQSHRVKDFSRYPAKGQGIIQHQLILILWNSGCTVLHLVISCGFWNPAHIMMTKPDDLEWALKSVATTHMMMMDVTPILTIMSLALKKEQVDLSSVQAIVLSTKQKSNGKITQVKLTPMKSSSLNQWEKFLYNILLNLQQRFPGESTDVVDTFAIPIFQVDPSNSRLYSR